MSSPHLSKPVIVAVIGVLSLVLGATAGSLTPPGAVGSTMHSLANIYDSIASAGFDSSNLTNYPVAQNGSLIGMLKYIEANMFNPSTSASLSATVEITGNGTALDQLKLTDSTNNSTVALTTQDGDFQIRLPSTSFSTEFSAVRVASASGATILGSPKQLSRIATITGLTGARGIQIVGKYAYLTRASGDNLWIVDISNPNKPVLVSTTTIGASNSNFVYVAGRYAYITGDTTDNLVIVDVSAVKTPRIVGSISGASNYLDGAFGITVDGGYAYVTATNSGSATLTVINVTDPSHPRMVSHFSLAGFAAFEIAISGKFAYLADGGASFLVLDISDPSHLKVVGRSTNTKAKYGQAVRVSGRYAYLTERSLFNGLVIMDISNPASPSFVGSLAGLSGASAVDVVGNYAFVGSEFDDSLSVVDISDPSNPAIVTRLSGAALGLDAILGLSVQGNRVYTTAFTSSALSIFSFAGLEATAISAGSIDANALDLSDTLSVAGRVNISGGAFIDQGLMVNDRLSLLITSSVSEAAASISSEPLFSLNHASGRISGDAFRLNLATNAAADYFTGNFAKFTLAGTPRFYVESSGAVLASGAAQFGAAGAPSSVSYSRFGTGAATATWISTPADLLLSQDLQTLGSATFAGNVGIGTTSPASPLTVLRGPRSGGYITGSSLTPKALSTVWTVSDAAAQTAGVFQTVWERPAGGGGISGLIVAAQVASSSAQDMPTGSLVSFTGVSEHLGTGTVASLRGVYGIASNRSSGTTTEGTGVYASFASFGAGTFVTAHGLFARPDSITAGTIQNAFNIYSGRVDTFVGGSLTNHAGLAIEHLTQATNNTAILIASTSSAFNIPAGNFGIYNGSPYLNYFAGNVGIGTSAPTTKLEVVGLASASYVSISSASAGYQINGTRVLTVDDLLGTWVGASAGTQNTGYQNTATGNGALSGNTTGSANSAFGAGTLGGIGAGGENSAFGAYALTSATNMNYNTALGAFAMNMTTSGDSNTAVGRYAMQNRHSGNANTALGAKALLVNEGDNNLALGASAGYANTLGSGNIFLGKAAGYQEHGSNTLWIDNQSTASASAFLYGELDRDWLKMGASLSISGRLYGVGMTGASPGEDYVCRNATTGEVTYGSSCVPSSIRFKTNIQDLTHGLDWVSRLRPVTFDWKNNDQPSLGMIAEEVASVSPLLALYQDGQIFSVNYQIMTAVLAKAIQEQQTMIDALKAGMSADPIPLLAQDDSSLLDRIVNLFRDLLGIEFGQGSVKVKQLCVGSVCVDEQQFMQVFGPGVSTPTPTAPAGDASASVEPTPDATVPPSPTAIEPTPTEPMPTELTPTETLTPNVAPPENPAPTVEPTPSEEPSPTAAP